MATTLAIISALSAAASFSGLILQYFGTSLRTKRVTGWVFVAAIAFSAYMLFVPGTEPVERVASKLRYVKREVDKDTLIQEATFSISGSHNVYAIQFPEPYRETPRVSVINIHGYCDQDVPKIGNVTNHFFEVRRWGSCPSLIPDFLQEYKWIAEGRPYQ